MDIETIEKVREALEFYANSDNYWSKPLPFKSYHLDTLREVRAAINDNTILIDRGKKAREALEMLGYV